MSFPGSESSLWLCFASNEMVAMMVTEVASVRRLFFRETFEAKPSWECGEESATEIHSNVCESYRIHNEENSQPGKRIWPFHLALPPVDTVCGRSFSRRQRWSISSKKLRSSAPLLGRYRVQSHQLVEVPGFLAQAEKDPLIVLVLETHTFSNARNPCHWVHTFFRNPPSFGEVWLTEKNHRIY